LIDHLLGRTKEVSAFETGLSTWGIGTDLDQKAWRDLIEQLLFEGLLREEPNDGRPLIGLGEAEAVRAVYRGDRRVAVRKPTEGAAKAGRKKARGQQIEIPPHDQGLFEALRAWRRDEAARQHVPPYVIFHDATLAGIAADKPGSLTALGSINGVGVGKLERYGEAVLGIVRDRL
jgi:ATP-dependent DNA helicase RecQ